MNLSQEFAGVRLGDVRLDRRLRELAKMVSARPGASLPKATGSEAGLEGAYRLLNNPRVSPEAILEPHLAATAERAGRCAAYVVAHDTTEFGFSTPREGLGRINDGEMGRGFF